MSKLRNVSLKFGSESEPMVLTDYHIKGLSSVASDKDVTTKKFSGWIEPKSGYISRGDKYALELLNDGNGNYVHIKCDNVTNDEYYMTCANNQTGLLEGAVTSIEAHGIAQSALEIEMESVNIISNPGEVDEKILKGKFSYNKSSNTFTVNPPSDNYGWKAEVTFKACPFYLSDFEKTIDSNYTRARIMVTATSIDGITILGVDRLSEGTKGTFTYALTPSVSTKVVNNVSWSNANTMNKIGTATGEYFAAEGERSDTITLTVEIKGMTNKLTASKNIIIDGAILNDTDKNPVVFAAVKTALGLGDDVHYFSTNDAEFVDNNKMKLITNELKKITKEFNFTEFKYFTGIEIMGDGILNSIPNLILLEFPDSITEMNGNTLGSCSKLNIDKLPEKLKTISFTLYESAPSDIKELPNTVTSITTRFFTNNQSYTLENDTVLAYVKPTDNGAYIKEYNVKDGIKNIGGGAFNKCTSLRTITIPNSVGYIKWEGTFKNTVVKELTANGINYLNENLGNGNAFSSFFRKLTLLGLEKIVPIIYNGAFEGITIVFSCTSLLDISFKNYNKQVFSNCIVVFDDDARVVNCSLNSNPDEITSYFVVDDSLYDEYIVYTNWNLITDRIIKRSVYDSAVSKSTSGYITIDELLAENTLLNG